MTTQVQKRINDYLYAAKTKQEIMYPVKFKYYCKLKKSIVDNENIDAALNDNQFKDSQDAVDYLDIHMKPNGYIF